MSIPAHWGFRSSQGQPSIAGVVFGVAAWSKEYIFPRWLRRAESSLEERIGPWTSIETAEQALDAASSVDAFVAVAKRSPCGQLSEAVAACMAAHQRGALSILLVEWPERHERLDPTPFLSVSTTPAWVLGELCSLCGQIRGRFSGIAGWRYLNPIF